MNIFVTPLNSTDVHIEFGLKTGDNLVWFTYVYCEHETKFTKMVIYKKEQIETGI